MTRPITITQLSKTGLPPKTLPSLPNKASKEHYHWVRGPKGSKVLNDYFIGTDEINIEAVMFLFSETQINDPDINSDYAIIATNCYQSSRNHYAKKVARFRLFLDNNNVVTLLDSDFEGLGQLRTGLKDRPSPSTSGRLFAFMLKILVRNIKFHITHLILKMDVINQLDLALTKTSSKTDIKLMDEEKSKALKNLNQLRRDVTYIAQGQYEWMDERSLKMIWNSIAYMERIEHSVEPFTLKTRRSWFGKRKK